MKLFRYSENDDRFYIKDSTIEGAGRGVFARRKISKGERLDVDGVLVERDSAADSCTAYVNAYKFAATVVHLACGGFDSGKFLILPTGFGGMVNHTNNETLQNVGIVYLESYEIAYEFLRDVEQHEEVLGYYGDDYQNMREYADKQQRKESSVIERFLELDLYGLGRLK